MSGRQLRVYTIGHSNRSLDVLIEMIRSARVDVVVDIRSFPRSRTNPQFNVDTLPEALAAHQIGYEHWTGLGGRRPVQKHVAPDTNRFWQNRSFHNFADYALSEEFQEALEALIELARTRQPAMMCSEAVWWRCHRRIIADHLLARGIEVLHIMEIGKTTPATMTPGAAVMPEGRVVYPP